MVLCVYWQVGGHAFVNFDDDIYVSENPIVLRGLTLEGVRWAFTTFHASNWHPLTWLSHMLDVELFGPSAGWHHRMNVLYHLLNTELLFLVLWRMTGGIWQSAFVAALFGVHPLHVESVAWVAERKDVLSTLFWILTMGAYLRYARRSGIGRYLLVAVPFALGLMCKPMLVTLPFVLLLLDWWPLGRLAPAYSSVPPSRRRHVPVFLRRVWEKVPLLGLSTTSCAITYLAQAKGGAVSQFEHLPFRSRISNAFVSYVVYLGKTVWPSSLAVYYPHPATIHATVPAWEIAGSIFLLCGLSVMALQQGHRRPYLAVGWLWYLGTLIPVIGLVQVGAQAMADRYTYVPLIGIFIALAWAIPELLEGWHFRRLALGVLGGAVVWTLSLAGWSQVGYWRDGVTLFSRAVAVTDRNWLAMNNLGVSYEKLGQYQQAIGYYREALQIKPDDAKAWNNLGVSSERLGQYQQAIGYYREALRIKPDNAKAWYNLGVSSERLGQYQQAIGYYREALRIKPDYANAWINLGVSYSKLGQLQQAISSYREAIRLKPDDAVAWNNLGVSYSKLGQRQQEISSYREAIRLKPDDAVAWNNLGAAYVKLGQYREAIGNFQEALRIKPDYAEARNNLVIVNGKLGQSR
jgi:tetratricopeptide (TPR) repeat protein